MIRVSCSNLEDVRKNPTAYAQQLLADKKAGGGSYGMFQCWQSKVKEIHSNELSITEAIKSLQQRFMSYADTSTNKKKQEYLLDRLKPYFEEFENKGYTYISSQKRVYWNIIPEVALTGLAPYIVADENKFVAYFFTEQSITWENQLRFPLLQYYIAKNICNCEPSQLQIGFYCLNTLSFNLKIYSNEDIEDSIREAENIFRTINKAYTGN